jgi:galactose mutarotase-like enzyme
MVELKNENLFVQIAPLGAELRSIVDQTTGIEYMWQADGTYWGRTSPILFPIVGKLKEDTYFLKNDRYELPQHGFARDCEFDVIEQTKHSATFELRDNEATFANYPFHFKLRVSYRLAADTLHVSWYVENLEEEKTMPFSIGAHPAFNLNMFDADTIDDFYLEFDKEIHLASWQLTDGSFGTEFADFGVSDSIRLAPDLFMNDALVFNNIDIKTIALKNMRNKHKIVMDLSNFVYKDAERSLGIWTPYVDGGVAPFICIEPWFGHADTVAGPFELIDKPGIIALDHGAEFTTEYSLQFY